MRATGRVDDWESGFARGPDGLDSRNTVSGLIMLKLIMCIISFKRFLQSNHKSMVNLMQAPEGCCVYGRDSECDLEHSSSMRIYIFGKGLSQC